MTLLTAFDILKQTFKKLLQQTFKISHFVSYTCITINPQPSDKNIDFTQQTFDKHG